MGSHRLPSSLVVVSALLGTLASCGRPVPQPAVPDSAIIVLVDTLRADHLSAYGYARPTSPQFDRLAAESTLFERAYSQAACTFPSVNSLLTSRPAPLFWGQPGKRMGIPADVPTLAATFQVRGLATLAVSASPVVRLNPTRFNPHGGFDSGFDIFDEQCLWGDARCVTARALELLAKTRGPFFAYLHYMDPHGPYRPPPARRRRFAPAYRGDFDFVGAGDPDPIARGLRPGAEAIALGASDRDYLVALYDEEIAWWDESLGQLLRALRERGWLERSALVVAADHGEAFLEHGKVKHCHSVFDEETRTPLLMRLPGVSPRRIAGPVENLDIGPTLLQALGFAAEPAFAGRSLLPELLGEPAAMRTAVAAQGSLRSLTDGRFKLILDLANGEAALYDLRADPTESKDVASAHREDFQRLRLKLAHRLAASEGSPQPSAAAARAAAEQLRALGYLQ
jgi:arylsulfatase A-like enzyme